MTVETTAEESASGTNGTGRPDRTTRYRRWSGPAVLVAAAAMALAACGGGPKSPRVANLGTSTTVGTAARDTGGSTTTTQPKGNQTVGSAARDSGGASTTTTQPKGNATALLNEWAACMRSNGDPNQAEPTVDANGGIHVTRPAGYLGTIYGPAGNSDTGAGVTCQAYLTAASTALNGGQPTQGQPPSVGTMDKYAACMRANGVPNYPDPGADQGPTSASPPNLNSPTFQKAAKECQRQVPAAESLGGTLQRGEIEIESPTGVVQEIITGTADESN